LDIAVSEVSLPRALRITDALLKALDARGMPLRIEPDGKRHSYVKLQGEQLAIRLVENTSRSEREPTEEERRYKKQHGYVYLPNRYSYQATGVLKLSLLGDESARSRLWRDILAALATFANPFASATFRGLLWTPRTVGWWRRRESTSGR
jgi:hypothetical protein